MSCSSYELSVRTDSPSTVLGATVELSAELRYNGRPITDGTEQFRYRWRDNAIAGHSHEVVSNKASVNWTVTYPPEQNNPGRYIVELTVERWMVIYYYVVTSQRLELQQTSE